MIPVSTGAFECDTCHDGGLATDTEALVHFLARDDRGRLLLEPVIGLANAMAAQERASRFRGA